jgi:glycosyltransferase 2 family protein
MGVRSRVWRLLRVVIALGLLALVVSRVEWSGVRAVLSQTRLSLLPLILLLGTLDRLWMAGKWYYLLRGLGVPVRFFEVAAHYYFGGLVGAAVQSGVGGDIARASAVGRHSGKVGVVATSVVLERLAAFIALGLLAAVSLVLVQGRYEFGSRAVMLIAAVPVAAAVALTPVLISTRVATTLLSRVVKLFPRLAGNFGLSGGLQGPGRLQRVRSVLLRFFLLTLAEQLVPLANVYLLKEALQLDLGPYAIVAITPLIMFFTRLPISVEGLGVYEGLSVLLFGLAGLSAASALTLALLDRIMGLLVLGLGGLTCAVVYRTHRAPAENVGSPSLRGD